MSEGITAEQFNRLVELAWAADPQQCSAVFRKWDGFTQITCFSDAVFYAAGYKEGPFMKNHLCILGSRYLDHAQKLYKEANLRQS